MEHLAPATLVADRFRLGEVLGRGGMATVWSAHDTRLARTVAIKILHDHLSDEDAARIEREARAAARISDGRVVTVLDLDHTADGRPFLVFEALSGRTLADEIRERGALPPERVERLADDLIGGLGAAHDCGVLHRDIKPSNVLLDGDGFRITDFGIASVDDETATRGDLIGTLSYLAPERFDGAAATAASDVFAAAAVLHEAVTGRQPFRAESAGETIERLRSGIHEPLPAGISPRLRAIIRGGLDPDPSRRPADARELVARPAPDSTADVRIHDEPTERLDLTRPLTPPVPPSPTSEPASPRVVDRVEELLERPGVAETVARAKRPQTLLVGLSILLLVLLLFAATRDSGGPPDGDPSPADPAAQLDEALDRIEEMG